MLKGKEELISRYEAVLKRIREAANKYKRAALPRLLAVSKRQGSHKIEGLFRLGQREFAENYCQGLEERKAELAPELFDSINWSFIGKIQSNKIKKIVSLCSEIQSLESLAHAEKIEKQALELGKAPYPVYILVNAGGEESKGGLCFDALPEFLVALKSFKGLKIMGLMSIPPKLDLEKKPYSDYESLYKKLRVEASQVGEGALSLGMSSDLELAIASGSDCVRVGTDLFGPRENI